MTVEQKDVIYIVTLDRSGVVILTISDHLSWDSVNEHLFCLQEKINTYLRFIESEEILSKYPNLLGHQSRIDVTLRYPVPAEANWFFDEVTHEVAEAGFRFTFRHQPFRPN